MPKARCFNTRYSVEGAAMSSHGAYGIARSKGFVGTYQCILARLLKGQNTWAELCINAPANQLASAKTRKKNNQAKREEMAAICAALDKRKMEKQHGN